MSEHTNGNARDILLEAKGLTRRYPSGDQEIVVLDGLDLEVRARELLAVVGASGSGKTTLLQILGTLDRPDAGEFRFQGRDMLALSPAALAEQRNRHIGFIFQFHHLLPEFNALENVLMPARIAGGPDAAAERRARELLAAVGLEKRLTHRSGELSGGEQQRVALARALIMRPALLLADEPTGNLDAASGQRVFSLLRDLSRQENLTVVMVTHNLDLARAMDRCLTLKDGRLHSDPG